MGTGESNNIYLSISYIVHMLFEFFLCAYVFILPAKYDMYYAYYILLLISLKLILRYECIISYFDKKLVNPNYVLGCNPKDIPYKKVLYGNNTFFIFLLNGLILLNLLFIFLRNKNVCVKSISIFDIILWLFVEYKITYILQ
jgi:hypothetical protein